MGNHISASQREPSDTMRGTVSRKRIGSNTLSRIVKRVTRRQPTLSLRPSSPATGAATPLPPCATLVTSSVDLITATEREGSAPPTPNPSNPTTLPIAPPLPSSNPLVDIGESVLSSGVASSLFSRVEPATLSCITTLTNQSSFSQCSLLHQDWCDTTIIVDPSSSNTEPGSPRQLLAQLSQSPGEAYMLLDTYLKTDTDPQIRSTLYNSVLTWSDKTECKAAQVWIARCRIRGWGVQADPTGGFEQLVSLATQGCWEAYCPLAMCYLCGLPDDPPTMSTKQTLTQDVQAALAWFRAAGELVMTNMHPAAKDTVAIAQFRVGVMLFKGQGAPEDSQQARGWFMKSAENGNKHAQYIVGLDFEMHHNLVKAKDYFCRSAEQGYADAQAELGVLLVNEQQYQQGIEWLEKAVQSDNPRAWLTLGVIHEMGQGVEKDTRLAAQYYQAAADHNDPSAQYLLGLFYHLGGLDLPQDNAKARQYFERSAETGFAPAQRLLGLMYAQGTLLTGDSQRKRHETIALNYFRRAACQGDVRALGLVGFCYENGFGTAVNLGTALQYYRKAAWIPGPFQGTAQFTMARLLHHMGRHRDAFQWFEQASVAPLPTLPAMDHQAQNRMARMMVARYRLHGWGGIQREPAHAYALLQQLTEEGVDQGQAHYWLAACLEEGIPGACDRHVSRAFDNYLIAAHAGDTDAEFQVALMLANAQGVDQDQRAAFGWYAKAAAKGHCMALYSLGLYYAKGIQGTPIDLDQARACFEKAARQGLVSAMTSLAILHYRMASTDKGHAAAALYWYRKAADRGDVVAQRDLGLLYESGRGGIGPDPAMAFAYLEKAAHQDDPQALLQLGKYYQNGWVVGRSPVRALKFYQKAALLGEARAPYAAAQVYYTLNQFEEAYAQCYIAANDPRLERSTIGRAAKLMAARLVLTHASLSPTSDSPHPCKVDAFQMLHRLAVQDQFSPSFYLLGNCYLQGDGVTPDVNHAHEWFKRAADEAKDKDAMLKVAHMYQEGVGVTADAAMAVHYLQKSADAGDPEGQFRMGMACLHGQGGIPANFAKAARWLALAAEQHHPESLRTLGQLAADQEDEAQATTWWQQASDLGCVVSMRSLATLLLHSKREQDDDEAEHKLTRAMDLLSRASREGDIESLVLLGQIHQAGTVTACGFDFEDEEEAEMWLQKQQEEQELARKCFEQASSLGHVGAMVLSAHIWHAQEQYAAALEYYEQAIHHGHLASRVMRARYRLEGLGGLCVDHERAYQELLDCAQRDRSEDALITLGQCCELGLGTAKDDRRAYEWYLRAADVTQDAEAMFLIGQMHAQGRVAMSYEAGKDLEALGWYQLAVTSQPHAKASYHMGLYYYHGIPGTLRPDVKAAVGHWREAAEQDHVEAMFELGQLLLQDTQSVDDQCQGFHWLDRAAEREHAVAQRQLGKHYHFGKAATTETMPKTWIVVQDFNKAFDLFSRAARRHDLGAAVYLGWYYEHGIHVAPCTKQAETWYRDAVRLGALEHNAADHWLAHLSLARLLHQDPKRQEEAETWRQTAHTLAPEEAKRACLQFATDMSPSDDEGGIKLSVSNALQRSSLPQ